MRYSLREVFALRYLKPLFNSLQAILVLAIILFVVGLLYQLWSISLPVDKKFSILVFTSTFQSLLTACLLGYMVFTCVHGAIYDESPFANPLSTALSRLFPKSWISKFSIEDYDRGKTHEYFCQTVMYMVEIDHLDHVSSIPLLELPSDDEKGLLAFSTITYLLLSVASLRAKQTITRNMEFGHAVNHVLDSQESLVLAESEEHDRLITSSDGMDTVKRLLEALRTLYDDASEAQVGHRRRLIIAMGCSVSEDICFAMEEFHQSGGSDPFKHVLPELLKVFSKSSELQDIVKESVCQECNSIADDAVGDIVRRCDQEALVSWLILLSYDLDQKFYVDVVRSDEWMLFCLRKAIINSQDTSDEEKLGRLIDFLRNLLRVNFRQRSSLILPEDFNLSKLIAFLLSTERYG